MAKKRFLLWATRFFIPRMVDKHGMKRVEPTNTTYPFGDHPGIVFGPSVEILFIVNPDKTPVIYSDTTTIDSLKLIVNHPPAAHRFLDEWHSGQIARCYPACETY